VNFYLRKVEKEFGLHQIKSSWEVKNEKGMGVDRESEIAKLVATSLEDKPSLEEWLDRLAVNEIDVRFNLTNKDMVQGISFIKDGEVYKGSSIGAKWSSQKKDKYPNGFNDGSSIISEIIQISPQDIPLMKAANLKSQQHPVRLNEVDRAMFDRSAEMAEMAATSKGRNGKFSNGRVEIALDSDRLKVRRVRPEKVILEATKVDGKWAPIGFPNISKVDVQLLERINKAAEMDFKETERKTSSKPNPDRVKVEQLKDLPEAELSDFPEAEMRYFSEVKLNDFPEAELSDFPEVELKYSPKANLENNQTEAEIKKRIQEAIDWAGEQSNTSGEEYIEYLKQQGIETNLELNANGDIMDIIYNMDRVRFESKELIDASPQQLSSARDLTFNLRKRIEESTPLKKLPQIDIKNGDPLLHLKRLMSNPQSSSMEESLLKTTIDREDTALPLRATIDREDQTPEPIETVEIVPEPPPPPPPPPQISLSEMADLPLTPTVGKIKKIDRGGRW
jgi:hypothetical protein